MKKTNLNNKGFSLVELIIVVAIMAVLVGVLAPVYLQYLEKTNKSADVSAAADIMNAMETTIIDFQSRGIKVTDISATVTNSSNAITFTANTSDNDATDEAAVVDACKAIIGAYQLKGDWDSTGNTLVIDADYAAGKVTFGSGTNDTVLSKMITEYDSIATKVNGASAGGNATT